MGYVQGYFGPPLHSTISIQQGGATGYSGNDHTRGMWSNVECVSSKFGKIFLGFL